MTKWTVLTPKFCTEDASSTFAHWCDFPWWFYPLGCFWQVFVMHFWQVFVMSLTANECVLWPLLWEINTVCSRTTAGWWVTWRKFDFFLSHGHKTDGLLNNMNTSTVYGAYRGLTDEMCVCTRDLTSLQEIAISHRYLKKKLCKYLNKTHHFSSSH